MVGYEDKEKMRTYDPLSRTPRIIGHVMTILSRPSSLRKQVFTFIILFCACIKSAPFIDGDGTIFYPGGDESLDSPMPCSWERPYSPSNAPDHAPISTIAYTRNSPRHIVGVQLIASIIFWAKFNMVIICPPFIHHPQWLLPRKICRCNYLHTWVYSSVHSTVLHGNAKST